jgi:Raf kinase inhibitor-like YbhB/YbcL family protein
MLEKIPSSVGRALRSTRAGTAELMFNDEALEAVPSTISVRCPDVERRGQLASRYTADGLGISPPLEWNGIPPDATSLVLLMEDADSPTPDPLVHAIVWDLPATDGGLHEGALRSAAHDGVIETMGRNSYLTSRYLPPDPPSGHGVHRYAFQIFALDARPKLETPGRGKVLDLLKHHAIAKGMTIGTYERA